MLVPHVNLPRDYKERASRITPEQKTCLEQLAETIALAEETITGKPEIHLTWDEEIPGLLKRITLGSAVGYDLEERGIPHYTSHNLGGSRAIMAFTIAQRYWHELMNA